MPNPFDSSARDAAGESRGLSAFGPLPHWAAGLLFALAVLPVGYVLWRTSEARLDVAYWDEFDTVLAFLLRLKEGISPGAFLNELFSVNNEHRMATSRLLFAVYFWLSGTINFTVLDWIGISWIVFACLLLVLATRPGSRRLKFAALLAGLFFQLEHYENFLWSGASIDHFQVVLLATGALVTASRGSTPGLLTGIVCAILATYTLAHGLLVWPAGAAMLWQLRDRRGAALWTAAGGLAVGGYAIGFKVNAAQDFATVSLDGAIGILTYWLSILGSVPALGERTPSLFLGAMLLALVTFLLLGRGARGREPFLMPVTLFAVGAMAMIAVGRAVDSGGEVYSRYYVLSALAWALALFMGYDRLTGKARRRVFFLGLPLLVTFNVAANLHFAPKADAWLECRNRAVTRFKQSGTDGRGNFTLHPNPDHATAILRKAEALGVYRIGPISRTTPFPADAIRSQRLVYHVDELTVNPRSVFVRGWVAIPGRRSERGEIHVILKSERETRVFTTVSITRPDVARVTKQPDWELAGFRFARRRDRLPTGEYQIGLMITDGETAEYAFTSHRVRLVGEGAALLATTE